MPVKALALGALAFVGSVSIAPAQAGWSGYYMGLHASYGDTDTSSTRTITSNTYFAPSSIAALESASAVELDESSFGGGASFGVNWDLGGIVLGVEIDADGFGSNTSQATTVVYPCCGPTAFTTSTAAEQSWFGTARARLGYGSPRALLYVTGGLAAADTKLTQSFSDTFSPILTQTLSSSEILTGWTMGGGIEIAIESGASIKLEYLYLDLGEIEAVGPIATGATTSVGRAEISDHVIRAGLNFQVN